MSSLPPRNPKRSVSSKAVCITKSLVVSQQTLQVIDAEAIKSIFGTKDVINSPVAVYSVAGTLRKGKSFFLNLMMRYLEFRCFNKESEWKNNADALLNKSFEWRGGTERETEGILVWSEPFWYQHNDNKIAIFLMDTQGVFDKHSSQLSDSVMFSLSTFLCSCQIYNLKDKISKADLEHLRIFSDYGKHLYGREMAESRQTLLFLMRDWQEMDFDFGFEGGRKYIDQELDTHGKQSDENKMLCENIQASFKDVKCALLPYPGNQIARRKKHDSPARLKDINQDFLDELEKIFQVMFENIDLRMLGGSPAVGEDIVNLAITLSNIVQRNKFGADALIEAFSTTLAKKLVGNCEALFHEKIQNLERKNISNQNVQTLHADSVKEVIDYFDDHHNLGVNPLVAQCAYDFKNTLHKKRFLFENVHELSKIGVSDLYRSLMLDCAEAFFTYVEEVYASLLRKKTYVCDEVLEKMLKNKRINALNMFEQVVEEEPLNKDIRKDYFGQLEKRLDLLQRLFTEENRFQQTQLCAKVQQDLLETIKSFIGETTQVDLEWEHFNDKILSLKDVVTSEFSTKLISLPDYLQEKMQQPYLKKVDEYINHRQEMLKEYQVHLWKKKKNLDNTGKQNVVEFERRERNKLKQSSLKKLMTKTKSGRDDEAVTLATECVRKMLEIELWFNKEMECIKDLRKKIMKLKETTTSNSANEANIKKMPRLAIKFSIPCEKLQQLKKSMGTTTGKTGLLFGTPSEMIQEWIESQKIHDHMVFNFQMNDAQKAKRLLVKEYNENVEKMFDRKQVLKTDLVDHHNNCLSNFETQLKEKFGKHIANTVYDQLKILMEANLSDWEVVNDFHRSLYIRTYGKLNKYYQSFLSFASGLFTEKDFVKIWLLAKPKEWVLDAVMLGEHEPQFKRLKNIQTK